MALFRNSTFAGSMMTLASGSRLWSTSHCTPLPSALDMPSMIGPNAKNAATAIAPPAMPAEKLLTSISKPGLILPSQILSSSFITQAPSGPMIMAPRNIGTSVPAMTPMVAIEPTTAPRMP